MSNDLQIAHYAAKLAYEIDAVDLFEAMRVGADVVVLDARREAAFSREHIAGAVHLPHALMTRDNTSHLRRDILYVVYCDGIGCNAATQGAYNLAKLGFTVKELIGGLVWWKSRDLPLEGSAVVTESNQEECGCA